VESDRTHSDPRSGGGKTRSCGLARRPAGFPAQSRRPMTSVDAPTEEPRGVQGAGGAPPRCKVQQSSVEGRSQGRHESRKGAPERSVCNGSRRRLRGDLVAGPMGRRRRPGKGVRIRAGRAAKKEEKGPRDPRQAEGEVCPWATVSAPGPSPWMASNVPAIPRYCLGVFWGLSANTPCFKLGMGRAYGLPSCCISALPHRCARCLQRKLR